MCCLLLSGKPIFSVDIHPDGTKFATGGQGKTLVLMSFWVQSAKDMGRSHMFYSTFFSYFRGGFWQSHDLEYGTSPARGG